MRSCLKIRLKPARPLLFPEKHADKFAFSLHWFGIGLLSLESKKSKMATTLSQLSLISDFSSPRQTPGHITRDWWVLASTCTKPTGTHPPPKAPSVISWWGFPQGVSHICSGRALVIFFYNMLLSNDSGQKVRVNQLTSLCSWAEVERE